MPSPKWNAENLLEFVRSLGYTSLKEWRTEAASSYNTAIRLGVAEQIRRELGLKRFKRKRRCKMKIYEASAFVDSITPVELPKVFESFWLLEFGMKDEIPADYTDLQKREFLFDRLVGEKPEVPQ